MVIVLNGSAGCCPCTCCCCDGLQLFKDGIEQRARVPEGSPPAADGVVEKIPYNEWAESGDMPAPMQQRDIRKDLWRGLIRDLNLLKIVEPSLTVQICCCLMS